jgi:hypothetical protein
MLKGMGDDPSEASQLQYAKEYDPMAQLLSGMQTDLYSDLYRLWIKQIEVEKAEQFKRTQLERSQIEGDSRHNETRVEKNAKKGMLTSNLYSKYAGQLRSLSKAVVNRIGLAHGSS